MDSIPNAIHIDFFFFFGGGDALCLHCSSQAFSSCSEQGLLFILVHKRLIAVAFLLQGMDSRHVASVVMEHGLSCPAACGIFPDLCPLHWKADS